MQIELKRPGFPDYTFEITNRIPKGYKVWCVNREGLEGYLPVCQVGSGYRVIASTLKAVPMPEGDAQIVCMAAMRYGADTVENAEKILLRPSGKNKKLVSAALEILKKYSAKRIAVKQWKKGTMGKKTLRKP